MASDLHYAEKDFKRKEEEYKRARVDMEKKKKEKAMLVEHMRLILYENQRKKHAKLQELRSKLAEMEALGVVPASPGRAQPAPSPARTAATVQPPAPPPASAPPDGAARDDGGVGGGSAAAGSAAAAATPGTKSVPEGVAVPSAQ